MLTKSVSFHTWTLAIPGSSLEDAVLQYEVAASLRLREEQKHTKWSEMFKGSNGVRHRLSFGVFLTLSASIHDYRCHSHVRAACWWIGPYLLASYP